MGPMSEIAIPGEKEMAVRLSEREGAIARTVRAGTAFSFQRIVCLWFLLRNKISERVPGTPKMPVAARPLPHRVLSPPAFTRLLPGKRKRKQRRKSQEHGKKAV